MSTLQQPTEAKTRKRSSGARAVTLADVAAQAGVSSVAASVVLSNARSEVRVSPSTRERILEAARQLEYRPNALARSLRLKRTNVIGFYSAFGNVMDPRYPFYGALLAGLMQGCETHQKDFLLHGTFRNRSEDDIYLELHNGQIDGLVLYARTMTPLIERLVESRLPVVTIINEVPGIPCVSTDNATGGRLLAAHLADQGYKRVLYRRTASQLPRTLQTRLDSFQAEADARGLTVLHSASDEFLPEEDEREILLAPKGERPEAVAAWSDFAADGVVQFLRNAKLRVPEDMAVTGFDGVSSMVRPAARLTTIRVPYDQIAHEAISLLVAQCEGKEVPERTELPVELEVGETT